MVLLSWERILSSLISAEDSHIIFFIRVMLSLDFQIFFVIILFLNINCHFNLTLGLIIDAFGELRDQQEQVKEDMEVRTFIQLLNIYFQISQVRVFSQNTV